MKKTSRTSSRMCAGVLVTLLVFLSACKEEPQQDLSLPSKENLYEYSVAVARRARSMVPPERERALFNIGSVHERFGMNEKAVALFREGLRINPVTVDTYLSLAEIYSLTDRGPEALKACHMALRYDPATKGVWTRIGQVLSHMQKHEEAIESFRTEIRRESGDSWTYANLGISCKALGLWEEAAAAYRKAVKLEPEMSEALYGLAEALRRLGENEEADSCLDRWKTVKKKQEANDLANRKIAGKVEEDRRKNDAALTWLDAAELFTQEHNLSVNNPQRQLRFLHHTREAVEEALKLNPAIRTAHIKRMDIVSKTESISELITVTGEAASSLPEDPFFSFKLAQAHLRALETGKGNQSIHAVASQRALKKALELAPNHAEANGLMAEVLLAFGPKDASTKQEVLACAKKAVSYSKTPNASAYFLLAKSYRAAGLLEEARNTLEEGIEKLPEQDTTGREFLKKTLAGLLLELPGRK